MYRCLATPPYAQITELKFTQICPQAKKEVIKHRVTPIMMRIGAINVPRLLVLADNMTFLRQNESLTKVVWNIHCISVRM